ncbi:serine hydrolase domain-containing protein [Nocardioides speluncae]|uniref:serine hydrolase domain-containing protein n=1 Tax=Nocardioides speluncae TaxID=2670337 RepID=UPI000D6978F0|nr:serine hydrolase domain-containing protein [Nocardioides speluncae]
MAARSGLIRAAAVVGSLLMLASCSQEPAEPAPERIEAFRPSDVPEGSSGSLVAALDGRVETCTGWGLADRENQTAADCDTVYDVGSNTKQFTAAAVMKLQMQGKLEVTDPIGRHLDGVPPDKRGIRLQQLLTHTAGLVDSVGDDYDPLTRDGLLTAAMDSKLRNRPGGPFHYSNVGYSLLALIIEEASGTSYEEYLAKALFAPAGMRQTGYVIPDWPSSEVALEYDAKGRSHGRPFDHPWAEDGPYWNLHGNGGMLSTARDMFRWHRALEGRRVLDAKAKAELFKPRVLEEPGGDFRYAYGWVVMQSPHGRVLWHNGGNGWTYSEIVRIPSRRAMVFWVTNQDRSSGTEGWTFDGDLGATLTQSVIERLLSS